MSKTVKIQDLPEIKQINYIYKDGIDTKKNMKRIKCNHLKKEDCTCNILYFIENVKANVWSHKNSFFGAFLLAYNNHQGVVLSVDDVWLTLCFQFAKYVNENSEKMRHLFVDNEIKKKLTVVTESEDWTNFFELMVPAIRNSVKSPEIVDSLLCDFSVTENFKSIMSVATIMDTLKEYFEYGMLIPCCGITQVKFIGTNSDWEKLVKKLKDLEKYDIDGHWKTYIENLIPILNKFIDTLNDKVDIDFWQGVMNIESKQAGSGSVRYISGWILNFFGIYEKVNSDSIQGYELDFPVTVENRMTREKKNVNVIGKFGNVNYENGFYTPQLVMMVFHDGVSERLL